MNPQGINLTQTEGVYQDCRVPGIAPGVVAKVAAQAKSAGPLRNANWRAQRNWSRAVKKAAVVGRGTRYPNVRKMPDYQWIETLEIRIDGEKRHFHPGLLRKYYKQWLSDKNQSGRLYRETMPFEAYMSEVVIPNLGSKEAAPFKQSGVCYLQAHERLQYETHFNSQGQVVQGDRVLPDGHYILVLTPDGKRLLTSRKEKYVFQHSSFMAGGGVHSAGIMRVKRGKITDVKPYSGHYRPQQKELNNLRHYLTRQLGSKVDEIRFSDFRAQCCNMLMVAALTIGALAFTYSVVRIGRQKAFATT